MAEQEPTPSPGTEIVVPVTGELIQLENPTQVAQALETLRLLENSIRDVKAQLTQALVEQSRQQGKKTLLLADGRRATIKGGQETVYDAEAIMEGLRQTGMSEERIAEIVQETVTYKVRAVEAKRAAAVNPDYKNVIDQHSRLEERRPSIEIRRD